MLLYVILKFPNVSASFVIKPNNGDPLEIPVNYSLAYKR